jgi:hypothetical protein
VATSLSVVMFCVIAANAVEVETKVHDTHEWISKCHLALTEHGFDKPREECFCTTVTPNANETQ